VVKLLSSSLDIKMVWYYIALHVVLSSGECVCIFTSLIDLFTQTLPQFIWHPAIFYNSSAKTDTKQINHCLLPGTHWYSWVNWSKVDWTKIYSKVLLSPHIFRILIILVERPKLYAWITALDNNSVTCHHYQHPLFLLIIIVQLFFNISDVLREHTSLEGKYHFHLTWQAE
jgi:hypothetical protein